MPATSEHGLVVPGSQLDVGAGTSLGCLPHCIREVEKKVCRELDGLFLQSSLSSV